MSTEQPLVHIVLLNWNGWRDTVECVRSLAALEYRNFRTVVLDNGSTDGSPERIREACPDVVFIDNKENLGFSRGCNVGIEYALRDGTDFVWLLNNDTTVMPDTLSRMLDVAATDPRIGGVGSVLHYMDDPSIIQAYGGGKVNLWLGFHTQFSTRPPLEDLQYLSGASLLIRRAAIEDVGLLDGRLFLYWDDTDYSFELRKRGWRLAIAEDSRLLHKEAATLKNTNNAKRMRYFCTSAVLFFKKHAPLPVVPIVIGTAGRAVKRVLRRNWPELRAVVGGAWEGWKRYRGA